MTKAEYTKADQDAVKILRDAYMKAEASDVLYDARQYLQDRARYENLFASGLRWTHAAEVL